MAPPSAADGLDGARRPAIVGHQGFDGEERLKQPQILCHLFPCRQKSADFDRRSHRVRRESHARFCERLAVKFHRPTHPPHLGQVVGRQECGATSDGEEPLRPSACGSYGLVSAQPTSAHPRPARPSDRDGAGSLCLLRHNWELSAIALVRRGLTLPSGSAWGMS
jgi:hypothetical protein